MKTMMQMQLRPAAACFRPAGNARVKLARSRRCTQFRTAVSHSDPAELPAMPVDALPMPQMPQVNPKVLARRARRQKEQMSYRFAAIAATVGVTVLAVAATYARFTWHVLDTGEHSWIEMVCTLALVFGGAVGMEMWARYAHKSLWHDYAPGWALHKSHHEPRVGPFEANDVFALVNGIPACALCAYGFFTPSITGGICFGAGLGITLFGIAYMFIHDGLVHRRFGVGPIAEWPYLKRVAVAHQLHHSDKYDGAPWGLFLGPQELEAIPGAKEELDRLVKEMDFSKR